MTVVASRSWMGPASLHVAVPALLRARPNRYFAEAPLMTSVPPAAMSVDPVPLVPVIDPPDQTRPPLTVSEPLPVRVPPDRLKEPWPPIVLAPLSVSEDAGTDRVCVPDPPPSVKLAT